MAKSKRSKRSKRPRKQTSRRRRTGSNNRKSSRKASSKSQMRSTRSVKRIKTSELPKTRSRGISPMLEHKLELGKSQSDVAYDNMTLTQLQIMARNRGIPFGGLPRDRLIRKINMYK
ncbi:hypothetical protein F-liban_51 [Faustovirus]|nr:hypothetical protein F-liban_51 [Faustovirus]